MDTEQENKRRREEMILRQSELLHEKTLKLNVAYAFIKFLREGYDALLYHGVNFRELPTYKEGVDIQNIATEQDQNRAFLWIRRLISDIHAHVRRKGFTVH